MVYICVRYKYECRVYICIYVYTYPQASWQACSASSKRAQKGGDGRYRHSEEKEEDCVLFNGTQFNNLCTVVGSTVARRRGNVSC